MDHPAAASSAHIFVECKLQKREQEGTGPSYYDSANYLPYRCAMNDVIFDRHA